jgi:hypothetical protein
MTGSCCNSVYKDIHGQRYHPRQSVVHIREVDYFVSPRLGVDCTHINDQRTKLKLIKYSVPCAGHYS